MRDPVPQPRPTMVFVIDDDEAVRDSQEALLTAAGFRVHVFGSGEEALREVLARRPDCVVLDIHMPGMGGFEVLERIRGVMPVPVILITGRPGTATAARARARGAATMLEKPLEADCLIGAIDAAVRG